MWHAMRLSPLVIVVGVVAGCGPPAIPVPGPSLPAAAATMPAPALPATPPARAMPAAAPARAMPATPPALAMPATLATPATPPKPTTVEKVVIRVVDGDTVVLEGRERVRVNNINAPEIDEELGLESRDFAVKLVHGKKAMVTSAIRDGYGRLVGDVVAGGKSLSEELVRVGLAHVYLIPPVDAARAARLIAVEAEARTRRLGVWATARYRGPFHITSFHANPRGNDMDDLNAEYVRIANISGVPQPLKGYTLQNRRGQRFFFRRVVVPAGHTIMVHSGSGEPRLDPAKQLQLFWNRRFPAWLNQGDTASLLGPDGTLIDAVTYDPHKRKVYPK
jgi:endonuclease YncB( thermonuclease family)